jgi:hypothetical protein
VALREHGVPYCHNGRISGIRDIPRCVSRHPALSVLGAVLVIGGAGALADTLTGPTGEGAAPCGDAERGTPGQAGGQQQRDAGLDYDSLWLRAAPLFGSAGQPSPRLRFVGQAAVKPGHRAALWVGPDESNCRTIFIAPGARRLLARSPGRTLRDRRLHRAAERWALHETAHYFQSDEVLSNIPLREYGATQWEKAHSRALLGTHRKRVLPRFNQWRDRDQFGSNYRGNPLTFTWPAPSPAVDSRRFSRIPPWEGPPSGGRG